MTKRKNSAVLNASLDPIVTSAAVFVIQAAVLLSASKTDFAVFSLAYSYVIVGQIVLASLFGAPLITVLGTKEHADEGDVIAAGFLRIQLLLALILAAAGALIAYAIGIGAAIALVTGLCFFLLSYRDALRSTLVASLQLAEALRVAIVFMVACVIQLPLVLLVVGRIDALAGLAVMGVAALVAVGGRIVVSLRSRHRVPRDVLRSLGGMAAWSLPGAVVIWLQNSFYLTIVAISIDLASVGEISASRMVIMPVLIGSAGLLRLWQVKAAAFLRDDRPEQAIRLASRMAGVVLGAGAVSAVAIFAALDWIPADILPTAYPNLVILVGGWVLFATAVIARSAYSSLYQAMGRYREIFLLNAVTLPFIIAGVFIAPGYIGLLGAILPMAIGELALLGALALRVRS